MARARSNGIELEYEVIGNPADPALLLIMGLGAQLIAWDDELVLGLARRGHFVIRFDNRDVGLSTHLDGATYTLLDMANDAAGLLDHLELAGAHVVGASLGGAVAQTLALEHPRRVRSLVSIMSSTGNPSLPGPKPEAVARLSIPVPTERAAYVEHTLATQQILAGSGFPVDEERVRRLAGRAFDRAFYPQGIRRQIAAVMASGSRREALESLRVPTLVVHGLEDPLVPVEAGLDTHEAIFGSELLLIDGMGHSLPRGVWPSLIDAVQKHVARAS